MSYLKSKMLWVLVMGWLVIAGCRQSPDPVTPSPQPTNGSNVTIQVTFNTTEEITAEPTPSPTSAPTLALPPSIQLGAQSLNEKGQMIIARAYAPDGGWLVIHVGTDSSAEVLGYAPLQAGSNNAIAITVDPFTVPAEAWATIHEDAGIRGTFEFPGDDLPLIWRDETVSKLFAITVELELPTIIATNQAVKKDGLLQIEQVTTQKSGWLALYNQTEARELLGFVPVKAGTTEQLIVPINWRLAVPNVQAVLLEDAGTIGRFQEDDLPISIRDTPVAVDIHLTLPPDLIIFDQPVVNNQVVVERAISEGPGWVVLYEDSDGELLTIVGFASLQNGLNERVPVPLIGQPTATIFVRLHQDSGLLTEFDYPQNDPPVLDEDGRIATFSFLTDAGSFILTTDQRVTDTVIIPLLTVEVPAWVLIQADAEGQPGETLGRVRIDAGMFWNLPVPLESTNLTPLLYVALYQDADTPNIFDYPNGRDRPIRVGNADVIAILRLLDE